jgi:hypothetical protein
MDTSPDFLLGWDGDRLIEAAGAALETGSASQQYDSWLGIALLDGGTDLPLLPVRNAGHYHHGDRTYALHYPDNFLRRRVGYRVAACIQVPSETDNVAAIPD